MDHNQIFKAKIFAVCDFSTVKPAAPKTNKSTKKTMAKPRWGSRFEEARPRLTNFKTVLKKPTVYKIYQDKQIEQSKTKDCKELEIFSTTKQSTTKPTITTLFCLPRHCIRPSSVHSRQTNSFLLFV